MSVTDTFREIEREGEIDRERGGYRSRERERQREIRIERTILTNT